jgi:hypothetical protein
MKALTAHLETEVSIANGYKHDLAGCVFRGIMRFGDETPPPRVAILEERDADRFPKRVGNDDGISVGQQEDKWFLSIVGHVEDDKLHPTDNAYELMADVKKALSKLNQDDHPEAGITRHPNYMLGGLICGITMEPGTVRPTEEQDSSYGVFWLRAIVAFVEKLEDPYNWSN